MSDFKSLNLNALIFNAINQLGYSKPTPIQLEAIPHVIEGKDILGIAQTGTGKTAAFSLPLLNHLCENKLRPAAKEPRALILAPTRELASQITKSLRDYGCEMEYLSIATIYGGVSIKQQINQLMRGNEIVVATPGRLIDLIERGSISLGKIEVLILDEADQMMDMGFIHALKKIIPLIPKNRQTLFFSATMLPKIKKLAEQFLNNPVTVSVTPPNSTAKKVKQKITFVNKAEKQDLLSLCLLEPDVLRSLVFTRTKHGADRVVKRLAQVGLTSLAIHGNKSQNQRQRALNAFREDKINILVATDVAARGIDIEGISHVFNYEIPNVPEQYIHRIGRTARADKSGIAHAFVDKSERAYLKEIQKLLKNDIKVDELPEDFMQKARALKTRTPVEPLQEAEKEGRKGRGKSRRKSIPSDDKNKAEGPKSEKDDNSNKYKKRDGKEGDQKARTDTDQKSRQWNKDKPRGERKFNKGDVRFRNKAEGPKSEKNGNSNKYKKRDGKEGDQKARTDTDQKGRQWNKDKPRGERKFNKGKGKNFKKEDRATTNPGQKTSKKPNKRSPTKYGKSNTKFRK
ncbi:DEAD/DEAH box helicase [Hellea sp.]|nr:DEAD/DEAH box helicase [Hellea sp.]MDA9047954.1 DEAD/DEAH box helicase [Hellea sp.]